MIQMNGGSRVNILITQPRRLAALSVAARVSQERAEDGSVGYSIRGETKAGPKTKLLFCTTGVVLRRLASENGLDDVSHLIVDEVSVMDTGNSSHEGLTS
jgi:ATP-dependent RNA helicase DHX57